MMTGIELAHVLRQAPRSGVYHLPPGGRDTIARVARELGFADFACDLAGCEDKAGFLVRVARALRFPEWFGHNWDALADCLDDMSWIPAEGYVVVLEHADHLRAAAPADFATALEIFEQAARDRDAHQVPLWVFVDLTADGVTGLRSLW